MELELPNRLYGEGLEPQVKKINNSCRLKLLELLKEKMELEFDEVMKDLIFSQIMVIQKNDLKFSARLVHSFLCKELMTSKRHEKWFTFARRPLRFGLQEYHAVTGLKVKRENNSGLVTWKDDDAVPALGEICGTKVSKNFTGPLCGNWRGCAKCSYEDIIGVENLFPENGILHSFMESNIDGVVLLATDFVQKDEKKDERVDRILDMINRKHDWNNHVWGVKEATDSEFEESGEEKGEDQTADTERGENSHVAGNVDGTLVKLSTMMQTVWGALAKIRCPPTPSCCRAPQTTEAAGMTRDDAENEPSDEATDAERGSRLHRSRRAPGQSRSCSPDDHQ
uniref:DUF1985 domain-containing protein n=1 Tax=Brassica oleracea var. oleracea TaxID=109376 RepID=A0A0D3CM91_BRAOL